jgi:hypothetical protein
LTYIILIHIIRANLPHELIYQWHIGEKVVEKNTANKIGYDVAIIHQSGHNTNHISDFASKISRKLKDVNSKNGNTMFNEKIVTLEANEPSSLNNPEGLYLI